MPAWLQFARTDGGERLVRALRIPGTPSLSSSRGAPLASGLLALSSVQAALVRSGPRRAVPFDGRCYSPPCGVPQRLVPLSERAPASTPARVASERSGCQNQGRA